VAAIGGADGVVFAGGIGENAPEVRERICKGLEWLGLTLDSTRNERMLAGREGRISTDDARLAAWVIPTDEELLIARDTYRVVHGIASRF
jgi:acetate kinase